MRKIMEKPLAKKPGEFSANYLVLDRKMTPTQIFELRWDKSYGGYDVVTLTADGEWLSMVSFVDEAEARREFERAAR